MYKEKIVNNNEANFSFQPPSQNTVLDRRIDLVLKLRLQLQGAKQLQDKQGVTAKQAGGFAHIANYGFPENTVPANSTVFGVPAK